MAVYTVHLDQSDEESAMALDWVILVADRFNGWAFSFGPFWLACAGLWLPLGAWLLCFTAISITAYLVDLPAVAVVIAYWASALLLGLEANSLRRGRLERIGYACVDVTSGRNREEAERRFLTRREYAYSAPGGSRPPASERQLPPNISARGAIQADGLFPLGGQP